jgi:tetratricopeptide (TPR) repeat protein
MQINFAIVLTVAAFAQAESGPTNAASSDKIGQAIQQLGDENPQISDRAYQFLWTSGRAAESAVEEAVGNKNPAIAARARALHDNFRFGIYHDSPSEILNLVRAYRTGDDDQKQKAYRALYQRRAYEVNWKLLKSNGKTDLQIAKDEQKLVHDFVEERILHDQLGGATEILSLRARAVGSSDYGALLAHTGQLDATIAKLSENRENPSSDDSRVLAYLLATKGEWARARAIAESVGLQALYAEACYQMQDWRALSQPDVLPERENDIEQHGFAATFHRLAGNIEKLESELDLVEAATPISDDLSHPARVFMVNDQWDKAVQLSLKYNDMQLAFDILVARAEFNKAFAVFGFDVSQTNVTQWLDQQGDDLTKFQRGLEVATLLHQLGETEKSNALLDAITEISERSDVGWLWPLATAEYKMGLEQRAFQTATLAMQGPATDPGASFRSTVYGRKGIAAGFSLEIIRRLYSGESDEAKVKRWRQLMRPDRTKGDPVRLLDDFIIGAEQEIRRPLDEGQHFRLLMAIHELCLIHHREKLATDYVMRAWDLSPNAKTAFRIGDSFAQQEQWVEAAEWYRRAWEMNRFKVVPLYKVSPLYLAGFALKEAGRDEEGDKLMQASRFMPLGDVYKRFELAYELKQRGFQEEALQQCKWILQFGRYAPWSGGYSARVFGAHQEVANALVKTHPWQAAEHFERASLFFLKEHFTILDNSGYVKFRYVIHKLRARDLLEQGKRDEARAEIKLSAAAAPGQIDLVTELVPLLDEADDRQMADDVFGMAFQTLDDICRQFPRAARYHNDLAWMCAQCNRRLDDAVLHAARAVELESARAGFLDTLALVHYLRGEKDEAIELAKKCIELEPHNDRFKAQLERFKLQNDND